MSSDPKTTTKQSATTAKGRPDWPETAARAADAPTAALYPVNGSDRPILGTLDERIEEARREVAAAKRHSREARRRAREGRRKVRLARKARKRQLKRGRVERALDPGVVTPIPEVADPDVRVVEAHTLIQDRAHARILYNTRERTYLYEVIEPPLDERQAAVLRFLRDTLYRTIDGRSGLHREAGWRAHLEERLDEAMREHLIVMDDVARERIRYYVLRDFLGHGPIEVLMRDPLIEDVSCDGPGVPVFVFHRQYESIRTNLRFDDEAVLDGYVIRLAQMCGKHISLAEPLLDATLPDSSRLQATLSREVTTRGSSFTIRRFRSDPLTISDLIRYGTLSPEVAAFFWLLMEHGHSMIFAGGTASGKTTTLNASCQFIPGEKKIVSIEDTREINLRQDNWIAGVARPGYSEGDPRGGRTGEIDMYALLESALRQRPEYLLVGEVRGGEAKTLFQAMATGHATYSTLHADSAMSAVYRLENPPLDIPRIMLQTLDALTIQTQVRIGDRLVRRIKEVTEVVGIHPESGDLVTNTVFRWDVADDRFRYTGTSHTLRQIAEMRTEPLKEVEAEWERRAAVLRWMADTGLRHIDDVAAVVRDYERVPEEVWDRVEKARREGKTQAAGRRPAAPKIREVQAWR